MSITPQTEYKDVNIGDKNYRLHKMTSRAAREYITQISSIVPFKGLGDYKLNEELLLKMLKFVGVVLQDGNVLYLTTPELVDNHTIIETLLLLEKEMIVYNFGFFPLGKILGSFEGFAQKLPPLISKILTDSLGQLLQKEKPRSTNSKRSIA